MSRQLWLILLSLGVIGIISLIPFSGVMAENTNLVSLLPPDTTGFPHLTAYLDVHDLQGNFVHGLSAQEVSIQENGISAPVTELVEQKPGVQFVIAINPGPSFGVRDTAGVSRYEYLLQGLLAGTWAVQPSGRDDLSMLTLDGPVLTHATDPAMLHSGLVTYTPENSDSNPGLEVLASAMQVASDPIPRPGMERAILYITSPQMADVSIGMQSILASANQQNIRIYVWLVAAQENLVLPENDLLRDLASQTHASYFAFSHDEPVPDLETILEPLRYVYQIGYDSHISAAGTQQVEAQVFLGGETVTSQPAVFELNLQPPALVILNPQTIISREFVTQPTSGSIDPKGDLFPIELPVSIQVSFPDGHNRQLVRASLFVDGLLTAEKTSPPFDQFVWDLRPYTQDGSHTLKVEAADSLGMIGQTNEISVQVTVPSTTQEVAVVVSNNRLLVIAISVLISASILILVLIVGGRIRPKPYPGQVYIPASGSDKTHPQGYRRRARAMKDPVTQPVKVGSILPVPIHNRFQSWLMRLPFYKSKESPIPILAHLVPLVGADEPTLSTRLSIKSENISLGSDPRKSDLVIVDPSIEGLHARIRRGEHSFVITDADSVAGTWVNYIQVPSTGTNLAHADIIHLGKIGFRFKLADPEIHRKVIVTPLEPDR